MGAASFLQSSFLGGEWSKAFQGRADHPKYRTAMALCSNSMPSEEGTLPRRSGFMFLCTTRNGLAGRLMPFKLTDTTSYAVEFTDGHLRMLNGPGLVFNNDNVNVTAISTATPAVITIASDKGWATGTQIQFFFDATGRTTYPDVAAILKNRQLTVTRLTGTTYSIADPVTGSSVVGTTVNFDAAHVPTSATSVLDVTTPWSSGTWSAVNSAQNQEAMVLLSPTSVPYTLNYTQQAGVTNVGAATLAQANMLDGPYLDEDVSGAWVTALTVDATVPSIIGIHINFPTWDVKQSYNKGQFSQTSGPAAAWISLVDNNLGNDPASDGGVHWAVSSGDAINGPNGLSSNDIGRCFRFKSEPPLWSANTTYALGAVVTYNGNYFTGLIPSNANNQPDLALDSWQPTTSESVAFWTWGRIISTYNAANATGWFHIEIIGDQIPTANYSPARISHFRFGVYGAITGGGKGFPTCAVFHQGRLWLAGAVPNRVDSSVSNQLYNFQPTLKDGTVADNNAISAVFNANEMNQINWMASIGQGIICGTKGGEWLVQASALNDPITPTSIQAHQVTSYGCANVPPVKTGLAVVFVQAFGRKCLEYLADVFSGKYSAPNLTEAGRHLTATGITELAYQEEQIPIVWVRCVNGGTLAGVTYRRLSSFVTETPSFAAWHRTITGSSQLFKSICCVKSLDGSTDILTATVSDINSSTYHNIQLQPQQEETDTIYKAWYLDDAVRAYNALITTSGGVAGLRLYGLWHLNGQTVDLFCGGIDCGTAAVSSGSCFVPFNATAGFTQAGLIALAAQGLDYGNAVSTISAGSGATAYSVPLLAGHSFVSEGQLLRPVIQTEAGSQNGPATGKTRRGHMFAVQFLNTGTGVVKFGTQDTGTLVTDHLHAINFTTRGNTPYAATALFTGIWQDTLDDDYNFDTMVYWRVERPLPATIQQVAVNLHTQDR